MKTIDPHAASRASRVIGIAFSVLAVLAAIALQGCSALRPATTPTTAFYLLDSTPVQPALPPPATVPGQRLAPVLMVNPPVAAAGFDSPRIIYVHKAHQLEYFAHSEWVDPPARMLGPLVVTAMARTGAFGAVVLTPGAASGVWRLDTAIIRLQHEFMTQPSQVHFTLRATLVDDKTRKLLAWREFDGYAPASSEDAVGGVAAANHVVQTVLSDMANFCAEAVRKAPAEPASTTLPLPTTVH
jgi:cholesterol transport system auxiliary component